MKLLDYSDVALLDTMSVRAITRPLAEQPTNVHSALTHDAQALHRLQQRADAYHMPLDDYLDMLIEEDYLAWLRWQQRAEAR